MKIKLFRCGSKEDINLCKGSYWSNYLTQCKPYYRGKISIVEVDLNETEQGKYLLSKEVKLFGNTKTWGMWSRVISTYGTEYNQNYYYISPYYLKKHSRVLEEYIGEKSYKFLQEQLNTEKLIIEKYC